MPTQGLRAFRWPLHAPKPSQGIECRTFLCVWMVAVGFVGKLPGRCEDIHGALVSPMSPRHFGRSRRRILHKFTNLWHFFGEGGVPCRFNMSGTGSEGFTG